MWIARQISDRLTIQPFEQWRERALEAEHHQNAGAEGAAARVWVAGPLLEDSVCKLAAVPFLKSAMSPGLELGVVDRGMRIRALRVARQLDELVAAVTFVGEEFLKTKQVAGKRARRSDAGAAKGVGAEFFP